MNAIMLAEGDFMQAFYYILLSPFLASGLVKGMPGVFFQILFSHIFTGSWLVYMFRLWLAAHRVSMHCRATIEVEEQLIIFSLVCEQEAVMGLDTVVTFIFQCLLLVVWFCHAASVVMQILAASEHQAVGTVTNIRNIKLFIHSSS